jgi:general secretion pathway protein L
VTGLGLGSGQKIDLRPWRWSLALATVALLINLTALNIDWWRMKSDYTSLRTTMIQIYKSAYPKESVIIDPIAQMQQKITAAKHNSGQAAPYDFTVITASFGEAWNSAVVATGKPTAISALEYHDQNLFVHLKPGSEAPTQQMKTELAKRKLTLDLAPEKSGEIVWKVRSTR